MSQTKELSSEALDLAVAKLPPLRRKVTERRLKNAKYREAVLDELAVSLSEDEECPCRAILQGPSLRHKASFKSISTTLRSSFRSSSSIFRQSLSWS